MWIFDCVVGKCLAIEHIPNVVKSGKLLLASLPFSGFLQELYKQKIKLTLLHQVEWIQYYEVEKAKANAIQQLVEATDKEIEDRVYALYGLTEEEMKIVAGV